MIDRIFAGHAARFLVVGAAAAVLQLLCYEGLLGLLPYEDAGALAILVATVFAYLGNRLWAFRSTGRWRREAFSFFFFRAVSLGINAVVLYVLVSIMRTGPTTAQVIGIVLTTLVNYIFAKLFVFRSSTKVLEGSPGHEG